MNRKENDRRVVFFNAAVGYEEGIKKDWQKAAEGYADLLNRDVPFRSSGYNDFTGDSILWGSLCRLARLSQEAILYDADWTKLVKKAIPQYYLAKMYDEGKEVRRDEEKAMKLYKRAAKQGHREALYRLIRMYEEGTKDEKKLVELYEKAAKLGHRESIYRLVKMYFEGIGVEKDEAKAFQLYAHWINGNNASDETLPDAWKKWYSAREEIGRGSSGIVYKIQTSKRTIVVKQVKATDKNMMWEEVQAMAKIPPHVNVVEIFGVLPDSLGVAMEYCALGGFRTVIQNHYENNTKIQRRILYDCLKQVCWGMQHLHRNGVIHRDLALRNILWSFQQECYNFKISDFGMSQVTQNQNLEDQTAMLGTEQVHKKVNLYTYKGTQGIPVRWMAPECLEQLAQGIVKYSREADVWSFGVTLWEMFCGELPYHDIGTNELVAEQVVKYNQRLECPPYCSPQVWNIAEACFKEPANRPSFPDIHLMQDDWIETDENDEIPICSKTRDTRVFDRTFTTDTNYDLVEPPTKSGT